MNAFEDFVTFVWKLVILSGALAIGLILFAVIVTLIISTIRAFYASATSHGEDE